MGIFLTSYFVRTRAPEADVRQRFTRVGAVPGSEWLACDWGDRFVPGLFEAGSYFTKELSARFGEAVFVCEDTRDNQMEYEHSLEGRVLRKLSWISDGNQSTWEWVEGDKEPWEDVVLFSEANLSRTEEPLRYDEDLALVSDELLRSRVEQLRDVW